MKNFEIVWTAVAVSNLTDIINFISNDNSVNVALEYSCKLRKQVDILSQFPNSGLIPKNKSLSLQNFKYLVSESHLVFYKVFEEKKQIVVYAIVHSKQNYKNLIV